MMRSMVKESCHAIFQSQTLGSSSCQPAYDVPTILEFLQRLFWDVFLFMYLPFINNNVTVNTTLKLSREVFDSFTGQTALQLD